MFLEASVSHFVRGGRGGGGGGLPPDRPPRIETLPWKDTQDRDPTGGHWSGRYESYWNAYLLKNVYVMQKWQENWNTASK